VAQRRRGTIVTWNDERGYGFIRPEGGGRDVFFHVTDADGRGSRPQERMNASYEASVDEHGRPRATRVYVRGQKSGADAWPVMVTMAYFAVLGLLGWQDVVGPAVFLTYLILSAVTMLVYRDDKRRASEGRWRRPERLLHLLELAGGWPGALVAQWQFRHKNRKMAYQVIFWLMVAINLALLALYATGT